MVVPVAREISTINQILSKGPAPTVEIGSQSPTTPPPQTSHSISSGASVSELRRECKSKGPQVPTLHLVLPYLELTAKQGYLVQRIRGVSPTGEVGVLRIHLIISRTGWGRMFECVSLEWRWDLEGSDVDSRLTE